MITLEELQRSTAQLGESVYKCQVLYKSGLALTVGSPQQACTICTQTWQIFLPDARPDRTRNRTQVPCIKDVDLPKLDSDIGKTPNP
ncbi:hypothetical protein ILYODFUR_021474 [Ilyodon furcidens]|uniref:Uncharacterized protein n=1 Tax=Ilyodon furcidens TaxID=33524 RepID=A0ABV0VFV9_9TELE